MAVINGSTSYENPFYPAVGDFYAQVSHGAAQLESAGAPELEGDPLIWVPVRDGSIANESVLVRNPVDGTAYRWRYLTNNNTTRVSAHQ